MPLLKVDEVCNKQDEYMTPFYAIKPIAKYIKPNSTIWCPFDVDASYYVQYFRKLGHTVINTHKVNGGDFFSIEPPQCDYIISNPPYSVKTEVLVRLFEYDIPFAMLVGVVGLFESQPRFHMFKDNKFEIMYFNKRVRYMSDYTSGKITAQPPFSSVYVCHNMLPQQIVFEEISTKNVVVE